MIIREWKIADNEVIEGLERECFKTPWTKEMLDGSFTLNNFKGFVADENGVIAGYVGVIYDDWDGGILNVAVKKSERRKGYGKTLMQSALDFLKEKGKENVFLEVRRSNLAAQNLYFSLGFTKIGERKKYYENTEDAFVLGKKLR